MLPAFQVIEQPELRLVTVNNIFPRAALAGVREALSIPLGEGRALAFQLSATRVDAAGLHSTLLDFLAKTQCGLALLGEEECLPALRGISAKLASAGYAVGVFSAPALVEALVYATRAQKMVAEAKAAPRTAAACCPSARMQCAGAHRSAGHRIGAPG